MKMKTLLLVSVVALLVTVTVTVPTHHRLNENLNSIVELAEKYNKSLMTELYVEDVSHLAEGSNKCQDKFFCKVYDILHEHAPFVRGKEEKELVRNLKIFVDGRNPNCTEVLNNVTATDVRRPIHVLVDCLVRCIQSRNLNGY